MIIPKTKALSVFSDDPRSNRREEAEALLKQMAEQIPNYDDPEPTANEYKSLHQLICGFIMWVSIVGTITLSAGSLYYLTIPKPSVYVTTQNGNLYLLHPISVQK